MTATTLNSFPSLHSLNSPRGWVMAIIVLLHLGFFWALSSGLTPSIMKVFIPEPPLYLPTPVEPKPKPVVIDEPVIEQLQLKPTYVEPVIDIPVESKSDTPTIYAPEPTRPNTFDDAGSNVAPTPKVVEPRVDSRRGLSEPFYPPQVIREGGEGTVLLSIYILADGRVGEVKLVSSSGYTKLDESAMREAKRWRFVPGTSDGKPVAMWKQLPVTFKLNTRM